LFEFAPKEQYSSDSNQTENPERTYDGAERSQDGGQKITVSPECQEGPENKSDCQGLCAAEK